MHINGPAGTLEARYEAAARSTAIQAVLCHPHPLYGGSMHDLVLDCLTKILLDVGVGVLRFNFRSVGESAGQHDGGAGEVQDLGAAADWLRSRYPGEGLWLGGYSFGAWVAWQAVHTGLAADRVLLVAPPVGAMKFPDGTPGTRADAVIGEADDFADPAALDRWRGVTLHPIAGADHFFSGRFAELAAEVRRIVTSG